MLPHKTLLKGPRNECSVYKSTTLRNLFHRKWLSETGFERRCGMWEPAVPICFLPSDPWLCDCAVMTRPWVSQMACEDVRSASSSCLPAEPEAPLLLPSGQRRQNFTSKKKKKSLRKEERQQWMCQIAKGIKDWNSLKRRMHIEKPPTLSLNPTRNWPWLCSMVAGGNSPYEFSSLGRWAGEAAVSLWGQLQSTRMSSLGCNPTHQGFDMQDGKRKRTLKKGRWEERLKRGKKKTGAWKIF